jgi:hypothetical protein
VADVVLDRRALGGRTKGRTLAKMDKFCSSRFVDNFVRLRLHTPVSYLVHVFLGSLGCNELVAESVQTFPAGPASGYVAEHIRPRTYQLTSIRIWLFLERSFGGSR